MRSTLVRSLSPALLVGAAACVAGEPAEDLDTEPLALTAVDSTAPSVCPHPTWCPEPETDWSRDLLATDLDLDLETQQGTAVVTFMPSLSSTGASLDVRGLVVRDVRGPLGPVKHRVENGRLDLGVPLGTVSVIIDYDFTTQDDANGYLAEGHTFLWPYFCGNLFPCKPETDDGVRFSLNVTGVPDGKVAVYPQEIPWEAPSYMLAFAYGDYVKKELGTTPAGTRISAWHRPGEEAATARGTAKLVDAFSFFEQTYGPYVFGPEAGSVSAPWRSGAYGGMEHHPLWHVGSFSMGDATLHIHEAAHGWFGNGVRMQCWEDFVLSEGSANYLAARAIEATYGAASAANVWANYEAYLSFYVRYPFMDTIAWPDGCNQIDLLHHPLWSNVPYIKGALFLRAVEQRVGRAALDQAMAVFYLWHVGKAATMGDLVETVEWLTSTELDDLVDGWLKHLGAPLPE